MYVMVSNFGYDLIVRKEMIPCFGGQVKPSVPIAVFNSGRFMSRVMSAMATHKI